MKNLSELIGKRLIVVQPSVWKKNYELRNEDEVIGKFSFPKAFSAKLSVEIESGKWEIYQPSFWNSLIAIKEAGKDLPFAKYKRYGFKSYGFLELPKGNRLKISFKVFRAGCEIQTLSGESLVAFKEMAGIKYKAGIFIKKRSELLDKYPWIIMLAWFLAYKRRHSAAAH